jgi:hypothetical protein
MGKKINLVLLFTFLLMFSLVSAVPPVTTVSSFPEGYYIEVHPIMDYYKEGQTVTLNAHIENSSNGYVVNSSLTCWMHLYNSTGDHVVIQSTNVTDHFHDYEFKILGGNFTKEVKSFHIYCLNGGLGGNYAKAIEVTYTGKNLSMQELIVYIIVLVNLIGLMIGAIILYPKLPNDERNEDGDYVSINNLTFLRNVALTFIWIMVISITFIVSNLAIAFASNEMIGNFIFGVWTIMMYSNLVIIPLAFIFTITDMLKKAKIKEMLERGAYDFK